MNDEIKQKSGFWKFSLKFIAIIILALAAGWGFARYQQYLGEKGVERLAEGLKQWEKDEYNRAMADTYGGKTPQETLQMYIDAVEKGDYELASRYFMEDKREAELKSLKNSMKEDIENIVKVLKKVRFYTKEEQENITKMNYENILKNFPSATLSYEDYVKNFDKANQDEATMFTKIDNYDFSVDFKLYPNGIWKIIEI